MEIQLMAKFKYIGKGDYLEGLPIPAKGELLDDEQLTEAQKTLLGAAVAMKMFELEDAPKTEPVSGPSTAPQAPLPVPPPFVPVNQDAHSPIKSVEEEAPKPERSTRAKKKEE
jgi:hypothetical protein